MQRLLFSYMSPLEGFAQQLLMKRSRKHTQYNSENKNILALSWHNADIYDQIILMLLLFVFDKKRKWSEIICSILNGNILCLAQRKILWKFELKIYFEVFLSTLIYTQFYDIIVASVFKSWFIFKKVPNDYDVKCDITSLV